MTLPVPPRPKSDVSSAVGLVGSLGLAAWVLFCHFWPEIAPLFGADPSRGRLTGLMAALTAVVATALPMVLWSVFVDKVHRNPSTGIDWDNPRPLSEALDTAFTKIAGLWATWAVIGCVYMIGRWYWTPFYSVSMQVLGWAFVPLCLASLIYVPWLDRYLKDPRDASWHFGALLVGREAWDAEEVKKHWRAWAVKGFFTAFMIAIVPANFAAVVGQDWTTFFDRPERVTIFLMMLMFLFDEQIGTVGYILTMKPLDAHIRSANPYLAGWVAALACYPPFQLMAGEGPINYTLYTRGDETWWHVLAGKDALLWLWAGLMIVLSGIYAWATVIFGIRFSNLTYRGVVTNGPYAFTRHPAYLSKNAFWWLGSMPFFVVGVDWFEGARNAVLLALVSAVYFWRAKTEEKHLLAEDPKYAEYHAWMAQHAPITRGLTRLFAALRPRTPQVLHPAE